MQKKITWLSSIFTVQFIYVIERFQGKYNCKSLNQLENNCYEVMNMYVKLEKEYL